MSWFTKAKHDHKDEIKSLELQLKALEDRKTFLPRQIDALKQELNTVQKQTDALKDQIRALKSIK